MSTGGATSYRPGHIEPPLLTSRNSWYPVSSQATTTIDSPEGDSSSDVDLSTQQSGSILPVHTNTSKLVDMATHFDEDSPRARLLSPGTVPPKERDTRSSKLSKYAQAMPLYSPPMPFFERVKLAFQNDTYMIIMYTILSFITRLYRIGSNPRVVWDEAHFGKFASYYIRHLFYFDVHPPIGKILVAVAGWISGFDGNFEFDSGGDYPAEVPFVKMRIIMALYGIAMVPIAYMTAQSLNWNWRSKHLFTIMILLDNGLLTISRFILLDSMLLGFTVSTVLGLVRFHRMQKQPFTPMWWFWLLFTGVSLGLVTGVKLVGLFVTALVGLYTVEDLWNKLGDLRMPVRAYLRHWCARILALIILPILLYMLGFKLHFLILYKSGSGDAQMSSLFQSNLEGSDLSNFPLEVAYGSKLTLKNMAYGGGLLHSHIQTYPEGSHDHQVTCYHHKDENNHFIISPTYEDPPLPAADENIDEPPRMLKSGDVLRLVHQQLQTNLRSEAIPAPITKEAHEVGCRASEKGADSSEYWIVEVLRDVHLGPGRPGMPIRTLSSTLRLRHKELGCYLRSGSAVLPDWGWKQMEVTCDPRNNPKDIGTHWNVESHWNDRLPNVETRQRTRSPFLKDFVHLNVAMMISNNALVPDQDKFDHLASAPSEWPFLYRGMRMNGWGADNYKYYLVGNPVIWWGSSLSLIVALPVLAWYIMRRQRRIHDMPPKVWDDFLFGLKVGWIGWFLQYFPFLMMGRVTYLHHYLPTLYFAVIVLVHLLDHYLWNDATARTSIDWPTLLRSGRIASTKLNPFVHDTAAAVPGRPLSQHFKNMSFAAVTGLVVGVFFWFCGVSFGMYGDISKWPYLKWRKNWDIY